MEYINREEIKLIQGFDKNEIYLCVKFVYRWCPKQGIKSAGKYINICRGINIQK
ncbi:hypothetical protein [Clostridioides sp. ZZV14-5902]|uniref:hypothetical protein n=1 Tax=Clostridioides sp. ZZV14-5902 TaxID=2811486 RepID=UPI001D109A48|nr:hypothetical protein [Clostridioides sp. ZZV14-5902]